MKILKKKEDKVFRKTCDYCDTDLELDLSDTYIGGYGCRYFRCPVCNQELALDEADGIELTVDNVEFPDHFVGSKGGVDIGKEEIKKSIKDGVQYFRKNPDEFSWMTACGNTFIGIYNYPGNEQYYVVVSKDYYDTYINYQGDDYAVRDRLRGDRN